MMSRDFPKGGSTYFDELKYDDEVIRVNVRTESFFQRFLLVGVSRWRSLNIPMNTVLVVQEKPLLPILGEV